MALSEKQLEQLRDIFDTVHRPVVLFDDDPDGLSSFLMIYKHIKEGRGMPVKSAPELGADFCQKVNDYGPDAVIIVDVPVLSQEFLNRIRSRIIWIDHHPVLERKGVEYFNPRASDPGDNRPTSYWVYKALQENLWIAMMGIVGDWFLPEPKILDEFTSKYPELLSTDITKPEVALHTSKLGELIQMISFNLKGKTSDVVKSVKVLTRIKEPSEILEQATAQGRFIYRKYAKLKSKYDKLLSMVEVKPDDKLLLFMYNSPDYSFSSELSNELLYKHPGKVIMVVWEYNGEYKVSMRSTKVNLPNLIGKALEGIRGYGGGHDHAAGANVKMADFDTFVENIRKQL
ncbi:DHH family phosphoesterase [Candidatus Woesearchaeota archaeon]|nr:DHH family phosphoesterase [Candidatus Woesearchaeota archaeon]